jgi:hypothetical protein
MFRVTLFVTVAFCCNLVHGQPDPATGSTPVLLDANQLAKLLDEKLAPLVQRLTSVEQEQAKDRQVNLNVCNDGFVTRQASPPCTNTGSMPASSSHAGSSNSGQMPKNCSSDACQEAYVPAKRISTTWVTSHKKVIITQPTPYIEVCTEWDPVACCNRSVYVTKYKDVQREVVVPYKKEMICEEVGMEKIKICLAD